MSVSKTWHCFWTLGLVWLVILHGLALAPLTVSAESPPADDFSPSANGSVRAIVVQPDRKIMVGGDFDTLSGQTRSRMARLNPDGTLDASFNAGADNRVIGLTLQSDGKILVNGLFTSLAGQTRRRIGRFNVDGTLDTAFDPSANDEVLCLAVQPDGKILVGGRFTTLMGQARSKIARLNPDGTLDTDFNPGASGTVHSFALQADGKILVGGSFSTLGGQTRIWIGRLNGNGTPDTFFTPPNLGGPVYCMALQPDGKILFSQDAGFAIGRLNSDGTLDTTFNSTSHLGASSIVIQSDGKILLGGQFTFMAGQPRNRLARLNPNGTLDATFTSDANGTVESLAVQPDGNILVGGSFAALAGQLRLRMARLINTDTATQSLTQTNSTITWLRGGSSPEVWRTAFEHAMDGTNWTLLGAGTRMLGGWQLTNVSLPPGGTLRARGWLAGGERNSAGCFVDSHHGDPIMVSQPASRTNQANTTARFWVVTGGSEPLNHQWLKNGIPLTDGTNVSGVASPTITLSAVFKSDEGNYQLRISNSFGSVTSTVASLTVLEPLITVQPMGTNRLVGESMTFSVAAAGTPPLQYQWYREGTALLGATDALLTLTNLMTTDAGYYYVRVSNAFGLVASLQTPLSINGLNAETGFNPGPNALVQSLAIQPDAKILVGGRFTTLAGQSRDRLGRLHPDGSLDTAFNPGASATVRCLALQADGEILVGGDFTTLGGQPRSYLGRLHPDGTLDTNFNPVANGSVSSLVWQPDGKILVGGFFTMLSGQPRSRIARIQQDGTPDMTFDPGADNLVECLTLQSDGKILVGGQFTTLGGQPRSRIGRLQPNGTLESIFNPGAGGTVSCVAQQSDGKILVAGSFLTLGSQDRRYLGRLLQNGTLDTTFAPSPNMRARSLAMQTDGKILAGGEFTSLGGQPRSYLGRLLPDGQLDPTFNPGASDNVYSLALQADGKILMGGSFSMLAGQTLSPLGRLNNNDMATQHLAYDGSAIIWQRGGGGPEVGRTSFEHSSDGSNWVFLGVGTRLVGGWQLTGVSLPSVGTLRARGYVAGSENDSGWFVESTLSAPWPIRVRLVHLGSSVVLSWVGGQGPFQVQQATYLDLPISWQDIGAPVDTNSVSLPAGPGPLFLRVREP